MSTTLEAYGSNTTEARECPGCGCEVNDKPLHDHLDEDCPGDREPEGAEIPCPAGCPAVLHPQQKPTHFGQDCPNIDRSTIHDR